MTRDSRRLALFALPVVCCAAHSVMLAVGVGSLTSLVGGAAGSLAVAVAVAVAGVLALLAVAAVVLRRRPRPEPTNRVPERGAR